MLGDIVHQDVFLLWVVFEIILERSITDQLLLELKYLFFVDLLVAECGQYLLDA